MPRDASDTRANPDLLLKAIEQDGSPDDSNGRGHLKIFFGYAAGAANHAMLQATHATTATRRRRRRRVHRTRWRPATARLARGIECIPNELVEHNGISAFRIRPRCGHHARPQLILVDELSPSKRAREPSRKRYQDVEELLRAGIDVYTTVNVQHIESLNDIVASITGIVVSERIPDRIFDDADQVELVDIEPEDLLERLLSRTRLPSRPGRSCTTVFFHR